MRENGVAKTLQHKDPPVPRVEVEIVIEADNLCLEEVSSHGAAGCNTLVSSLMNMFDNWPLFVAKHFPLNPECHLSRRYGGQLTFEPSYIHVVGKPVFLALQVVGTSQLSHWGKIRGHASTVWET